MIICQRCKKRPAEIQTTQKIGGSMVYVSLCSLCYEELKKQASSTPNLDKFGKDLTKMAKEGLLDPVIGRDDEISRVIHVLSRRTKNNPVLIGDPGVGKTAIVEGLAQRIADGKVPETLKGKRVISLDIASILAGTGHRGQFEERVKNIIEEVINAKGLIILFIDELHMVVGAGATQGSVDAANILKPSLAKGQLQLVGATTIDEYRRRVEKDAALERRFQTILVNEPTLAETKKILRGLREKYESFHKVRITDGAIDAAAELSDRYISERFLPDKAIDLIDESCAAVRLSQVKEPVNLKEVEKELEKLKLKEKRAKNDMEKAKVKNEIERLKSVKKELIDLWTKTKLEDIPLVTRKDVAKVISKATGIPLEDLSLEERERLANLEKRIHETIVGQDEAVKIVSEAIRRARAGLKSPNRPIGAFLFLGPTGVGKTELAKALAKVLYGKEDMLVRFDMSEFMEKHSVSKLIGSPPGYVGYEDAGQLTDIVRRKPFSVILLDELEKAHPQVLNILLQIMEDGRLTDSQGRTVDFKNTIIIMTSNLGTGVMRKARIGFEGRKKSDKKVMSFENLKQAAMEEVRRFFTPEFINRLDEIVVFKPLTMESILRIVDKELAKTKALLKVQKIDLNIDEKVKEYIARNGFDEVYGARPLRRLIQKVIENPVSSMIVNGEVKKKSVIDAFIQKDKVKLEVVEKAITKS